MLPELTILDDGRSIEGFLFLRFAFNNDIPFVAAFPLLKLLVLHYHTVLLCQRRVLRYCKKLVPTLHEVVQRVKSIIRLILLVDSVVMRHILCNIWVLTEFDKLNDLLWSLSDEELDELLDGQSLLRLIFHTQENFFLGKCISLLIDGILVEVDLPPQSGQLVIKSFDGFIEGRAESYFKYRSKRRDCSINLATLSRFKEFPSIYFFSVAHSFIVLFAYPNIIFLSPSGV